MTGQLDEALFRCKKETYEGSFVASLFEQCKLDVQSAENASARRIASSRYLLTLNAACCPLRVSILEPRCWLVDDTRSDPRNPGFVPGHRIIKSHQDLNHLEFGIIHEPEQHLPVGIHSLEWPLPEEGRGKACRSVANIERRIPLAFLDLHLVLLIVLAWNGLQSWAA